MTQNVPPEEAQQKSTPAAASPPAETSSGDPRLQRIAEQWAQGLSDPSLRGNLSACSCELMALGYQLKQAINEHLASNPRSLKAFGEASPAIDGYLRMLKQIADFAQLDCKLTALHRAAEADRREAAPGGRSEDLKF